MEKNNNVFDLVSSFLGDTTSRTTTTNNNNNSDDDNDNDNNNSAVVLKEKATTNTTNITEGEQYIDQELLHDDNYNSNKILFNKIQIIIFTKDRPWQLQQLLQSMKLLSQYHHHDENINNEVIAKIELIVIAKISDNEYHAYYDMVRNEFEQTILHNNNVSLKFIIEDENDDMKSILCKLSGVVICDEHDEKEEDDDQNQCRNEKKKNNNKDDDDDDNKYNNNDEGEKDINNDDDDDNTTLWMFLTDDCLLLVPLYEIIQTSMNAISSSYDSCSTSSSSSSLSSETCFAFISRLHPGISWCQTKNIPSIIHPNKKLSYHRRRCKCCYPTTRKNKENITETTTKSSTTTTTTTSSSDFKYVEYASYKLYYQDKKYYSNDWSYPFDLSGGIYTKSFIKQMFSSFISDTDNSKNNNWLSHPNKLEIGGNNYIQSLYYNNDKKKQTFQIAIPTQPFLVILTINRVQTLYNTPLAITCRTRTTTATATATATANRSSSTLR